MRCSRKARCPARRALGITQPTAGRHIEALEQALNVKSFHALANRPSADRRRARAADACGGDAEYRGIARTRGAASGHRGDAGVQGVVRVSASEIVGVEVLPPMIAALREWHPGLVIEFVLSNRVQDLLKREADIAAVRMVRPKQSQLVARRIGSIEIGLHARRDYLEKHGTPRDVAALAARTRSSGYDRPSRVLREAGKSWPAHARATFSLRADSDLAQLSLIRGRGHRRLSGGARAPRRSACARPAQSLFDATRNLGDGRCTKTCAPARVAARCSMRWRKGWNGMRAVSIQNWPVRARIKYPCSACRDATNMQTSNRTTEPP